MCILQRSHVHAWPAVAGLLQAGLMMHLMKDLQVYSTGTGRYPQLRGPNYSSHPGQLTWWIWRSSSPLGSIRRIPVLAPGVPRVWGMGALFLGGRNCTSELSR